jgi:hypothetical protein
MAEAYKVLKIDELTRVSDTTGIERYYRHTIKTRGGTVLTVDIDEAQFTPERAKPILEKRAIEADKILSL